MPAAGIQSEGKVSQTKERDGDFPNMMADISHARPGQSIWYECLFHEKAFLSFLTGMLHGMVGFIVDVVCCRFQLGVYRHREVSHRYNRINTCFLFKTHRRGHGIFHSN